MLVGDWQDCGIVEILAEPELAEIVVSPEEVTIEAGGSQQFTAALLDQYGDPFGPVPVEWSVEGVGSISEEGLFTAPGVSGTATVIASVGDVSGEALVAITFVMQPPPERCDVHLRLTNQSGDPLVGAVVSARLPSGYAVASDTLAVNASHSKPTDADGLVTLKLFRNQDYELTVAQTIHDVKIPIHVPNASEASLGAVVGG